MQDKIKIYYPQLGIHTYIQALISNPPEGYEFVTLDSPKKRKFIDFMKKSSFAVWAYTKVFKKIFNVFGLINKIYYSPSPNDSKLIFSTGPLIPEQKPWVLKILDTPFSLGGNDYEVFLKNKEKIEGNLLSSYCKNIIVHTGRCFEHMAKYFSKELMKKVILVTPAIPGESIKRNPRSNDKGLNLLFLGSINNPDEFLMKGGLEALESFKKISKEYPNTKLIMRCKVPQNIKEKYLDVEGIEFVEQRVSYEELQAIYLKSDALLMPGYGYFIMAFLEAFQYGLPIISLDTYGVNEFVKQGKTGFYVKPSTGVPTEIDEYPANVRSKKFAESIIQIDNKVINELNKKIKKLIENRELLENMSKECQKEFKEKYSYTKKISKLKEIFDEALE
jgi:glycosyltransferase involved in cell wall biosynthesis